MERTYAEFFARSKGTYDKILGKVPKTFWSWAVEKRQAWLTKQFTKRIEGAVKRLVKEGSGGWSTATWGKNFRELLRAYHIGALGAASRLPLTQSDFGRAGALLQKQYRYARNFERQIQTMLDSGKSLKDVEKYITNRSKMYLRQGEAAAERIRLEQAGYEDDLLQWVVDRAAESCDECLARDGFIAKRKELPWMPGDGQSSCLAGCRCEWSLYQSAADSGDKSIAFELASNLIRAGRNEAVKDISVLYGDDMIGKFGDVADFSAVYSSETEALIASTIKQLEADYAGWISNLDSYGIVAPKQGGQVIGVASMGNTSAYLIPANLADEYVVWCEKVARMSGKTVAAVAEQFPLERFMFASGMEARGVMAEQLLTRYAGIAEFKSLAGYAELDRIAQLYNEARMLPQFAGRFGRGTVWESLTMSSSPGQRFGHLVWDISRGNTDDFVRLFLEASGTSRAELESLFRLSGRGFVDEALLKSLLAKLPALESEILAFAKKNIDDAVRAVLPDDILALSSGAVKSVSEKTMPGLYGLCSWEGDITLSTISKYANPTRWAEVLARYPGMDIVEKMQVLTSSLDTLTHEYIHGLKFFDDMAVLGGTTRLRAMRFIEELWVSSQAGPVTRQVLRSMGVTDATLMAWFESAASDGYSWYIKEVRDIALSSGMTLQNLNTQLARLPIMMRRNMALYPTDALVSQKVKYEVSSYLSIMQAACGDSLVLDGQVVSLVSDNALMAMKVAMQNPVFDEFVPKKWYGVFVKSLRRVMKEGA